MKNILVKFSPEAQEVYDFLRSRATNSKIEKSLLTAIDKKIELIKSKQDYGNKISRKKIPYDYIVKYEVNNLFRVELPNYWRMLYSLMGEDKQIEIIAFVLDVLDHDKYSKLFGYK